MEKNFNSIDEFIEHYGLIEIPSEDEVVTESLKATIGAIIRDAKDWKELKEKWKGMIGKFVKQTAEYEVSKADAQKVNEAYKTMVSSKSYNEYKKAFELICKLIKQPVDGTSIYNVWLNKSKSSDDKFVIRVQYTHGKRKVIIPNGLRLAYTSPKTNLKELAPLYKTGENSKSFHSSPRCYFKLHADKPIHGESKLTTYTPKITFQTAFIDSLSMGPKGGLVYIDTKYPVSLVKFNDKADNANESTDMDDDLNDSQLFAFEKYNNGELTTDEFNYVMDVIDEHSSLLKESTVQFYTESLGRKINDYKQRKNNLSSLKKFWNKTAFKTIIPKVYTTMNMSDNDYEQVKNAFIGMRKDGVSATEYMKHFMTVSRICNIPAQECIIRKYTLTKGTKPNKNHVRIEYQNAGTRLTIPSGYKLYHKSPIGNLKYLQPQIKGRSAKGHLYSTPRVYCSIHKDMGKSHADITKNSSCYTYEVQENIKYVYVDPLVPFHMTGAVYISTTHPINIKRIDELPVKKESTSEVTDIREMSSDEPSFASLEEFMEYYGLEYADDDMITESTDKKQFKNDIKNIMSMWKKAATGLKDKTIKKQIDIVKRRELTKDLEEMNSSTVYSQYKRLYTKFCQFFGVSPDKTLIRHLYIGKDCATLEYSDGRVKITIPAGTRLQHVSPADNIDELKPSFKSKVKGAYMYSSPRVFFTIAKDIPLNKAGLEGASLTKYTPTETIRTAYIDQACTTYKLGAVYVETKLPIKVKKIPMKDEKTVKESAEMKLSVYESEILGNIDNEYRAELIKKIDETE